MWNVAYKMLVGDRAKYVGMIFGVAVATFLICQQLSIFVGLMSRTFGFIDDTGYPDVWVMDEKVQFVDDVKPLQDTTLYRVRGTDGVAWAVPMYKGLIKARLDDGTFQNCIVVGLDDATLIGGPPRMREGRLEDLRRADGVIVDSVGAADKLARPMPDGTARPLAVGDAVELNDRRAVVVGICEVSRTFQSQPVIYTTYTRATTFAPRERKLLSFVLAGAQPGVSAAQLAARLDAMQGLAAYTQGGFARLTWVYFAKYTGIPINFGISTALGLFVGTAIVGLTFYQFTSDNLRHLGALKAMGATNGTLVGMTLLQATLVAVVGYGIGVGLAAWMGLGAKGSELAFRMMWWIPAGCAGAVLLICYAAAVLSLVRVIRLEPGIVFRG